MFRPKRSPLIRRLLRTSLLADQSQRPFHLNGPINERHDLVAVYDSHLTSVHFRDSSVPSPDCIPSLWTVTDWLLRTLTDSDLEDLLNMVEVLSSRDPGSLNGRRSGKPVRRCIRLPQQEVDRKITFTHPYQLNQILTLQPQELMCAHWRWADILDRPRDSIKLKCNFNCHFPVCNCTDYSKELFSSNPCINPFHWSRECTIDYPPPPYSCPNNSAPSGDFQFEIPNIPTPSTDDEQPHTNNKLDSVSSINSTETGATLQGTGSCVPRHIRNGLDFGGHALGLTTPWCSVACWSYRRRVGPQTAILEPVYHVSPDRHFECDDPKIDPAPELTSSPLGDARLTLRLERKVPNASFVTSHPSLGRAASSDSVIYLYNETRGPVFVDGPQHDPSSLPLTTSKVRVAPGHCACVYHAPDIDHVTTDRWTGPRNTPTTRPRTVRISLGKGWGPGYSRQSIESCPKWIEISIFIPPHR